MQRFIKIENNEEVTRNKESKFKLKIIVIKFTNAIFMLLM